MRPRFKNAIFFTTDMDARLAHPTNYSFTRNMLIASSYGLRLNQQLQQNIPPFRDSYQTSTFMAGLLALGPVRIDVSDRDSAEYDLEDVTKSKSIRRVGGDNESIVIELNSRTKDFEKYLTPQIFEIALSEAYSITPKQLVTAIHPIPRISRPSSTFVWKLLLVAIATLLLIIPLNPFLRRFFLARNSFLPEEKSRLHHFTVFILLSITAIVIAIYIDGANGTGEPFEFAEGISVWPTELCRLLVVFLCVAFFAMGLRTLRKSSQHIERRFLDSGIKLKAPISFWKHRKACLLYTSPSPRDRG